MDKRSGTNVTAARPLAVDASKPRSFGRPMTYPGGCMYSMDLVFMILTLQQRTLKAQ